MLCRASGTTERDCLKNFWHIFFPAKTVWMDYFKIKQAFNCEDDPTIKYKRCHEYIVQLKTTETTRTNESRSNVVNANFAKFRGIGLICTKILDTYNCTFVNEIYNYFYNSSIVYEVNEIPIPDGYTEDIEVVCGHGVHFFNTLFAACFYNRHSTLNILFSDHGQLLEIQCIEHVRYGEKCSCFKHQMEQLLNRQ
jgi:hypothetical protein